MLKQTLAVGAAMAAALAVTASAQATTYFAGYTTAGSPSGLTPIVAFAAPSDAKVDVFVQDCCVVGDYYATFVDGSYIGTTPYEPQFGSSSGYPNSAATFLTTLSAGTSHDFQLADETGFDLPAGVYVSITAVPEPTSWALIMLGIFGLGGALRANRASKLKPETLLA